MELNNTPSAYPFVLTTYSVSHSSLVNVQSGDRNCHVAGSNPSIIIGLLILVFYSHISTYY